jgi:hypothetical protein
VTAPHRTILVAAAIFAGLAGIADAADGKGSELPAGGRNDAGASTKSMGAGGLSGTGATQGGARTGSVESKGQPSGAKAPSAPAAGTTR